jgi:hypothetical protein
MTKETAADYLPLVQALADDRLEEKTFNGRWVKCDEPDFRTWATTHFRIKLEPEIVPYTYEDDIVGMRIIPKREASKKWAIIGQDGLFVDIKPGHITYPDLLRDWTHLDGSPCGKVKA